MRSDAFGCVRKQLEGFGKIGGLLIFLQLFQTFSDGFEGFLECFEHYAKFHTFLDVWDNFSYLLSLVIYRERPFVSMVSMFRPGSAW